MLRQVEVGAAVYALHLLESERHVELYVGCGVGIVGELLVVVETVVLRTEAQRLMPLHARLLPCVEPLQLRAGLHEELHLHLFELAHAEYELPCHNLVAERLAYLRDAERHLHASGLLHVEIVYEYSLCRLRAQIYLACRVCGGAHLRREHQIELSYVGPVLRSAYRIDYPLIEYYLLELLQIHGVHSHAVTLVQLVALLLVLQHARVCLAELSLVERLTEAFARLLHLFVYLLLIFCYLILYEHVGAVAFLRVAVVYERVIESVDMSRRLPYCRVHEYSGVDAHDVLVQEHHALPPVFLDIVFQFNTVLSVVVYGCQTVVDVAAGKHKTVFLAVRYYFLKNVFLCHCIIVFLYFGFIKAYVTDIQNVISAHIFCVQ